MAASTSTWATKPLPRTELAIQGSPWLALIKTTSKLVQSGKSLRMDTKTWNQRHMPTFCPAVFTDAESKNMSQICLAESGSIMSTSQNPFSCPMVSQKRLNTGCVWSLLCLMDSAACTIFLPNDPLFHGKKCRFSTIVAEYKKDPKPISMTDPKTSLCKPWLWESGSRTKHKRPCWGLESQFCAHQLSGP